MCRKLFFPICFVLVLGLAGNTLAMHFDGGAGAGSPYWNLAANWDGDVVPTATDDAMAIKIPGYGPTVNSLGAVANNVYVGIWTWAGELTVTSSGSLTTVIELVIAEGATDTGVVFNEGDIDVGANMCIGKNFDSSGLLNMNGGTIDIVGNLSLGVDDATGHANFHGGIVTAAGLLVQGDGTGTADFTTGVLIFGGDLTEGLDWMATMGWWTAYGGSGIVMTDYDDINPGCTTVWGIPEPATVMLLGLGGLALVRRKR